MIDIAKNLATQMLEIQEKAIGIEIRRKLSVILKGREFKGKKIADLDNDDLLELCNILKDDGYKIEVTGGEVKPIKLGDSDFEYRLNLSPITVKVYLELKELVK